MAIMSVITVKARDGKTSEVIENFKIVKRIVERAGGKYRVVQQVYGANPRVLSAISEFSDWSAFGKVRSDPEMQQLMARIRDNANPAADPIAATVVEEIAI